MTCLSSFIACLMAAMATSCLAFAFQHPSHAPSRRSSMSARLLVSPSDIDQDGGRRSFLNKLAVGTTVIPFFQGSVEPAAASGGATAGGAYLLSAKQRYNERVKASVKGLLDLESPLKNGDSKPAKAFFESEDGGSWKDLTSAGYLLSNAFRRNSTTPPDSLSSVKAYKAFAAEVANLQKTLKKKGASAAADDFSKVETALDNWLGEIDLSSEQLR